jgi:Domain of unknown function (DUF4252)
LIAVHDVREANEPVGHELRMLAGSEVRYADRDDDVPGAPMIGDGACGTTDPIAGVRKAGREIEETTNISLDSMLLKFASAFLSGENREEAAAKKLTENLRSVYVRAFEFDNQGAYSASDLQPVYDQLKDSRWNRIITSRERDSGEDVGVWVYREGENISGLVMVATEPREVTIVNIVGPVRLQDLAVLGGQFGIPKIKGR